MNLHPCSRAAQARSSRFAQTLAFPTVRRRSCKEEFGQPERRVLRAICHANFPALTCSPFHTRKFVELELLGSTILSEYLQREGYTDSVGWDNKRTGIFHTTNLIRGKAKNV